MPFGHRPAKISRFGDSAENQIPYHEKNCWYKLPCSTAGGYAEIFEFMEGCSAQEFREILSRILDSCIKRRVCREYRSGLKRSCQLRLCRQSKPSRYTHHIFKFAPSLQSIDSGTLSQSTKLVTAKIIVGS